MTTLQDPGVQTVLENMETIVASEGGTLNFISLDGDTLSVEYIKGINEECPECVPDHENSNVSLDVCHFGPQNP